MGGTGPTGRTAIAGRWRVTAVAPGAPCPAADDPRWLACAGPSTAAAALRECGRWSLDDPQPRAFDAQDWWWELRFDAPFGPEREATLGFDGLATLARAWLNGHAVLDSDNMFVQHRVALAPRQLQPHDNALLIQCAALNTALAARRPRPRWKVPMLTQQQLRWFRTTLLGRTPGWSPPAAPVGPWRDVWLAAGNDPAAAPAELQARLHDGQGIAQLSWHAGASLLRNVESAELELSRGDVVHRQALAAAADGGAMQATLHIPQPELWWPHTHGEPALYRASLHLHTRDGQRQAIELGAVGFRTVEVDQANGGFRLRVNGVPVFCRGAGWTPLDPVSLRSTPQQCHDAVAQARSAGMNMLRLAGTMVVEEDHFYRTCDQLGLLVWQDFMFASMDYPAEDPAFAHSVAREASQQLRRLRAHPCIAVLCGNSEVEQQAAMWGAARELWQPALFHQTLARLCEDEAPGLPYWPSSAHGGAFPHQACEGTTSYYGVGAYQRPLDDARRSDVAFATECLAFANIPERAALQRMPAGLATRAHHPAWKARSPRDLGAGWDFDDVRDHYLERLFGVRPDTLRYADHDRYLALARLATAEAMAAVYTEWRRPASRCGGALVLMLRDLWAGAGWGVVDDAGVPKACWHALRRTLQPVAVLLTDEGMNGVHAHLLNETAAAQTFTLAVTAWRDGDVRVASAEASFPLAPHSAQTVPVATLFEHLADLGWAWRFGPPVCDAIAATLRDVEGNVVSRAFHFPLGWGLDARAQADIGLAAQARLLGPDTAEVNLHTRRLAVGVHLDIPGWAADDNHFHLAPGERRCLHLQRTGAGDLAGTLHALNTSTAVPVEAFA
jgi:beta-mannosidase